MLDSNYKYNTATRDLLITALGIALKSFQGLSKNYISIEDHGRIFTQNLPEVRDTIGWFTTMYPIETVTDGSLSLNEDIERFILDTKDSLKKVPNRGIGYGLLGGYYDSPQAPLPKISFNYLGQFRQPSPDNKEFNGGWSIDIQESKLTKDTNNENSNKSIIDITAISSDGIMQINVDSRMDDFSSKRFILCFKEALDMIIDYTINNKILISESVSKTQLQDYEPYISNNSNTLESTIFLLPPGEGGAESYLNNIAKNLSQYNLVIFNNIHLINPMDSFESLGRYYAEHIKNHKTEGPYNLIGWSFGGVLAIEIAINLIKEGEDINNLYIIDSYLDVKSASQNIGLGHIDNILDPINYYYKPSKENLKKLEKNSSNITFFKAGKTNDIFINENQKKIFEYYHKTSYNNLDKWFSPSAFTLKTIYGETHHSWVHSKDSIKLISDHIITEIQK